MHRTPETYIRETSSLPPGETGSGLFVPDPSDMMASERSLAPIHIHTLGCFDVAIGSVAPRVGGKGKQRPLLLLKALIALGGRGVAGSQLWECLWPDSDGDLAARNLAVTLHRLRDLLGATAAVLQQDGKLSLNDRMCEVDAWTFEHKASEGLARVEALPDDSHGPALLWQAFALYRGHFLACEMEQHWMLPARLRMRAKFERLVCVLAERLERRQAWGAAADVCLRGIECDPLNELLYRRLMRCYLAMGEYSSVLRTYRRCLEALCKGLAVQPSDATQEIYLDAVRGETRSAVLIDRPRAGRRSVRVGAGL